MKVNASQIIFLLFVSLLLSCSIESAKILGVFSLAGKSVHILHNRLMKGLADAGHDVTVISAYKNKLPISNGSYTDVLLTGFAEDYDKYFKETPLLERNEQNSIWKLHKNLVHLNRINREVLAHPNVKELLSSDAKFDLLIAEYFWNENIMVLSQIYQCPIVLFTSLGGVNPYVNDIVGNPLTPSYVPHFFFTGDFSNGMNFFQKIHNFLFYLADYLFKQYFLDFIYTNNTKDVKGYISNMPDVSTLYDSVALLLLGSHSSIRQATPLSPNTVEIGGFHIYPPKKLPKDLQDFLDSSKNGVIYFSMGSHINSSQFSPEKIKMLLNVFKRLDQNVLWKFEAEELTGKPSNVLIKSWLPQMDLLAHPNVKLFITHGGHGSNLETVYHGVPCLMIPVFFDQYKNSLQAVELGYALKLSYNDKNFNENTLYTMIQELLNNPKYRENVQLRSRLFHDRPLKPMDAAVYWIEYVIKHKGADHLKIGGRHLSWYEYYSVDVVLFLTLSVISIPCGFYLILKCIFKKNVKVKKS